MAAIRAVASSLGEGGTEPECPEDPPLSLPAQSDFLPMTILPLIREWRNNPLYLNDRSYQV